MTNKYGNLFLGNNNKKLVSLHIPEEIHELAKTAAKDSGLTFNHYMLLALYKQLSKDKYFDNIGGVNNEE